MRHHPPKWWAALLCLGFGAVMATTPLAPPPPPHPLPPPSPPPSPPPPSPLITGLAVSSSDTRVGELNVTMRIRFALTYGVSAGGMLSLELAAGVALDGAPRELAVSLVALPGGAELAANASVTLPLASAPSVQGQPADSGVVVRVQLDAQAPAGLYELKLRPLALPSRPAARLAALRALGTFEPDGVSAIDAAPPAELSADGAAIVVAGGASPAATLADARAGALTELHVSFECELGTPAGTPAALALRLPASFGFAPEADGLLVNVSVVATGASGAHTSTRVGRIALIPTDGAAALEAALGAPLARAASGAAATVDFDGDGGADADLPTARGDTVTVTLPLVRVAPRSSEQLASEPAPSAAEAAALAMRTVAIATRMGTGGARDDADRVLADAVPIVSPGAAALIGGSLAPSRAGRRAEVRLRAELSNDLPGGGNDFLGGGGTRDDGGVELELGGGFGCDGAALAAFADGHAARAAAAGGDAAGVSCGVLGGGGDGGACPFGNDTLALVPDDQAIAACAGASTAIGSTLRLRFWVPPSAPAARAPNGSTTLELLLRGLVLPPRALAAPVLVLRTFTRVAHDATAADADADDGDDAGGGDDDADLWPLAAVDAGAAALATLAVRPGALNDASSALSATGAAVGTTISLSFRLENAWSPADGVTIGLPVGFAIDAAVEIGATELPVGTPPPAAGGAAVSVALGALALSDVSTLAGASELAAEDGGTIVLELLAATANAPTLPAGSVVGFIVRGVVTPKRRQRTAPLRVTTRTAPLAAAVGVSIDSTAAAAAESAGASDALLAFEIGGFLSASLALADGRAGVVTSLRVALTPSIAVRRWDRLRVTLPAGYALDGAAARADVAVDSTPVDGAFTVGAPRVSSAASGGLDGGIDLTISRSGGTELPANRTLVIVVTGVRTPGRGVSNGGGDVGDGGDGAMAPTSAIVRLLDYADGLPSRETQAAGLELPLRALANASVTLSAAAVGARADATVAFSLDEGATAAAAAAAAAGDALLLVLGVPEPLALAPELRALLASAPNGRTGALGGVVAAGALSGPAALGGSFADETLVVEALSAAGAAAAGLASPAADAGVLAGALGARLPPAVCAQLVAAETYTLELTGGGARAADGGWGALRLPSSAATSGSFTVRVVSEADGALVLAADAGLLASVVGLGGASVSLETRVAGAAGTLTLAFSASEALAPTAGVVWLAVRVPAGCALVNSFGASAATANGGAAAAVAAERVGIVQSAASVTPLTSTLVLTTAGLPTADALPLGGELPSDAPANTTTLYLACATAGVACAVPAGGTIVIQIADLRNPPYVPATADGAFAIALLPAALASRRRRLSAVGATAAPLAALAVSPGAFSPGVLANGAIAPATPWAGGTTDWDDGMSGAISNAFSLSFTLSNELPADGAIVVSLPATMAPLNASGAGVRATLAQAGAAAPVEELGVTLAVNADLRTCSAATACLDAPSVGGVVVDAYTLPVYTATLARAGDRAALAPTAGTLNLVLSGLRPPTYALRSSDTSSAPLSVRTATAAGRTIDASATGNAGGFGLRARGLSTARVVSDTAQRAGGVGTVGLSFVAPTSVQLADAGWVGGGGGGGGGDDDELLLALALPCAFSLAELDALAAAGVDPAARAAAVSIELRVDGGLVASARALNASLDSAGTAFVAAAAALDCDPHDLASARATTTDAELAAAVAADDAAGGRRRPAAGIGAGGAGGFDLARRVVLVGGAGSAIEAAPGRLIRLDVHGVVHADRAGVSGGLALALINGRFNSTLLQSAGGPLRLAVSAAPPAPAADARAALLDARAGARDTALRLELNLALPLPAAAELLVRLPASLAPWAATGAADAALAVVATGGGGDGFTVVAAGPTDGVASTGSGTTLALARGANASALAAGARVELQIGPVRAPDAVSATSVAVLSRAPGAAAVGVALAAALGGAAAAAEASSALSAAAAAATASVVTSAAAGVVVGLGGASLRVRDGASLEVAVTASNAALLPAFVTLPASVAAPSSATVLPARAGEPAAVRFAFAHASTFGVDGRIWLALPPGFARGAGSLTVRDALVAGAAVGDAIDENGASAADAAAAAWRALRDARVAEGRAPLGAPASWPSVQPFDGTLSVLSLTFAFATGDGLVRSNAGAAIGGGGDGFSAAEPTFATIGACDAARAAAIAASPTVTRERCRLVVLIGRASSAAAPATPMLPGDAHALVLAGVLAPAFAGALPGAAVVLTTAAGAAVDSTAAPLAGSGVASDVLNVAPSALQLATLNLTTATESIADAASFPLARVAGARAIVQLAFRIINPLPSNGGLRITLPNGFGASSPLTANLTADALVVGLDSPSALDVTTPSAAILVDLAPFVAAGAPYAQVAGTLTVANVVLPPLAPAALPAVAAAALAAGRVGAPGAGGGVVLRATRGGIAPEVAGGSYVIVTLSGVTMPPFAHVACCAEVATLSEDGLLIDVSLPLDAIVVTPGAIAVRRAAFSTNLAGALTDFRLLLRMANALPPNSNASLHIELSPALAIVAGRLLVEAALVAPEQVASMLNVTAADGTADGTAGGAAGGAAGAAVAEALTANETAVPFSLNGSSLELFLQSNGASVAAPPLMPATGISPGTHLLIALRAGLRLPPHAINVLPGFQLATFFTAGVGPVVDSASEADVTLGVQPNKLWIAFASDERRVGARANVQVTFALSNAMLPTGRIDIFLPDGFALADGESSLSVSRAPLSGAEACELLGHRDAGCPSPAAQSTGALRATLGSAGGRTGADGGALVRVSLACALAPSHADSAGCALAADRAYRLTLGGLRNPLSAALYAVAAVESVDELGRVVDAAAAAGAQPALALRITPHELRAGSVLLSDARAGAVTAVTVRFKTTNPIPPDGRIFLAFPRGFLFVGPATGFELAGRIHVRSEAGGGFAQIEGALIVERAGGKVGRAADDSTLLLRRNGTVAATAPGATHAITVRFVQNPLEPELSGGFGLETRTAAGRPIDVASPSLRVVITDRAPRSGGADGGARADAAGTEALPAIATMLSAALLVVGCVSTCVLAPRLAALARGACSRHRRPLIIARGLLGASTGAGGKRSSNASSAILRGGSGRRGSTRRSPRTSGRESIASYGSANSLTDNDLFGGDTPSPGRSPGRSRRQSFG